MSKKKSEHYVNNAEFSQAVADYVTEANEAKERGETPPKVTPYIADCFVKICNGISYKPNFSRYTFRDEMVMDGVENCLRAIENYNLEAATRSGRPNAFSYFTKIAWFAFLRRIKKEQKQQDIKMKYISQAGIDTMAMVNFDASSPQQVSQVMTYVNTLKSRIESTKDYDMAVKEAVKEETENESKATAHEKEDNDE